MCSGIALLKIPGANELIIRQIHVVCRHSRSLPMYYAFLFGVATVVLSVRIIKEVNEQGWSGEPRLPLMLAACPRHSSRNKKNKLLYRCDTSM